MGKYLAYSIFNVQAGLGVKLTRGMAALGTSQEKRKTFAIYR
jgi:hypothetical protein